MPAYFESGFMVREPAWHKLGTVLRDFPGREEAIKLAGHDFTIVERPFIDLGQPVPVELIDDLETGYTVLPDGDVYYSSGQVDGWKQFRKFMPGDPTHDMLYHVGKESFTTIQNTIGWDVCDLIVGEGAKYESAGVLKQGAQCWVLAWLDEPVQIKGDNSPILPFICVTWAHDGTGSLKARSTSWRVVCANTESASEAEGERTGTNFTFRHTKHYKDRIEDAKEALKGMRQQHSAQVEMARELAKIKYTKTKREQFIERFIPIPVEAVTSVAISDQKLTNIHAARDAVRSIFESETVPDAHKLTGYGMHLAGVEFLDHLRGNRSQETKFTDSMLRHNPMKARLGTLIREVANA